MMVNATFPLGAKWPHYTGKITMHEGWYNNAETTCMVDITLKKSKIDSV